MTFNFKCDKCGTRVGVDLAENLPDFETPRYEEDGTVFFKDAHMICPVCKDEMGFVFEESEDQNNGEDQ